MYKLNSFGDKRNKPIAYIRIIRYINQRKTWISISGQCCRVVLQAPETVVLKGLVKPTRRIATIDKIINGYTVSFSPTSSMLGTTTTFLMD